MDESDRRAVSEVIVKEAVPKGMDTELRDSIIEAVEESDGTASGRARRFSGGGALLGLGATIGYLVGQKTASSDDSHGDIIEQAESITSETTEPTAADTVDEDDTEEPTSKSRRLPKLVLLAALVAGIALLRRRFSGGEDEEWEPIEEFEPAGETTFDSEPTTAESDMDYADEDTDEHSDADDDSAVDSPTEHEE